MAIGLSFNFFLILIHIVILHGGHEVFIQVILNLYKHCDVLGGRQVLIQFFLIP
jgi:hypothetical protein